MSTATQVLAFEATGKSHAGDNNGRWVWSALGYPVYGAWCGGFQLLSLKTNNVARPTTSDIRMIYVPYIIADAKKAGKWIISKNSHPGDLVIFDWSGREVGGDHVGMILENDPSKSYVITREGNAGAGANGQRNVADHTRSRSLISGCVNMQSAYTKAATTPPKTPTVAKPAEWTAGTKVGKALQDKAKSTGVHDGYFDSQDAANKKFFPNFTCIRWTSTRSAIHPSPGVKAWQKLVGVKADGYLGQETAKATQRWAGLKGKDVDGYLGTKSVEAICKKLGVK